MPRQPTHHRVKMHLVYTPGEVGEVVGVHRKTITRWVRESGLPADTTRKPWLIRGADLKRWLIERRHASKSKLAPGEIYCLPCRGPKRPAFDAVDYRPRTEGAGILVGLCPDCERLIHRVVRRSDLDRVTGGLEVTVRQPLMGLNGGAGPLVSVPIREEPETHVASQV